MNMKLWRTDDYVSVRNTFKEAFNMCSISNTFVIETGQIVMILVHDCDMSNIAEGLIFIK